MQLVEIDPFVSSMHVRAAGTEKYCGNAGASVEDVGVGNPAPEGEVPENPCTAPKDAGTDTGTDSGQQQPTDAGTD